MTRAARQASTGARAFLALAALLIALGGGLLSTTAQRPNGAGMVIRHGDGTLIYAYVQFDEESISGMDLIVRSGIDVTLAPFGGLGGGVCAINGEGCPSDNCFCQSFSSPAFFWHYYSNIDGNWRVNPVGPAGRTLRDGDIDGWSWTSGESGLPSVTIDEIALMNGFDRSPPEPTQTPTQALEPTATWTATPEPTHTATPADTVTPQPEPTSTTTPVLQLTPTIPATPTQTPVPSPTELATSTATAQLPTPTAASTATETPAPSATPTRQPSAGAVIVPPGGTPEPLDVNPVAGTSSGNTNYMLFAALLVIVVTIGGFAVVRSRTGST